MHNFFDWKFLLGLLAAIAGVVVPVYLWRVDLNAHSLRFRIVSQTPLQPKEVAGTTGFKVFVDGQELKSPHLSVIEISNDGAKPIPSSNFETALEIDLEGELRILRADVTSTSPKDIRAQVKFEGKSVQLLPLLLNPRDSVTLALITEGSVPIFQPRARISGVSGVAIEDASKPLKSMTRDFIAMFISFIYFVAAWILSDGVFCKHGLLLFRKGAMLTTALLSLTGFMLLFWSAESMAGGSALFLFFITAMVSIMAMLIALLLGWAKKAPPPAAPNEP